MSSLVDCSHAVWDGLITYPGLPGPLICDFLSREQSRERYADGTEFQIARIELVANTGTYVDAPFHRYAQGKDLSELPLESLADLETTVIRTTSQRVDAAALKGYPLRNRAVLIQTGHDRHWNTPQYFQEHPFLTLDAALYLVEQRARLVGIDSLNIDDIGDRARPVHSILLQHEIPIAEHLTNLASLPDEGARFFAVPVKMKGVGTFPVRAFGLL